MKKIDKFIILLGVLGFALWFGGTAIRYAIAYDLFQPGAEMDIKTWYPADVQMHVVFLFSMTIFYTSIGYGLATLAVTWILIRFKRRLRNSGWLFMGSVLFLLSLPAEAYLFYYDVHMNMAIGEGLETFDSPAVDDYFIFKLKDLGIVSSLSFLAALTSVIFFVWQPLEKKENRDEG
jgi:hypothetical protein